MTDFEGRANALRVLRGIAEGDDYAKLFQNAPDDALRVEAGLRKLIAERDSLKVALESLRVIKNEENEIGGRMLRDEIMELAAGREVDALIAVKVMGWQYTIGNYRPLLVPTNNDPRMSWVAEWDEKGRPDWLPHYSTEISAAWQVIEKMLEIGFSSRIKVEERKCTKCAFWRVGISRYISLPAPTAPLAICRAALMTVQL